MSYRLWYAAGIVMRTEPGTVVVLTQRSDSLSGVAIRFVAGSVCEGNTDVLIFAVSPG
jgi:hypothetical protein